MFKAVLSCIYTERVFVGVFSFPPSIVGVTSCFPDFFSRIWSTRLGETSFLRFLSQNTIRRMKHLLSMTIGLRFAQRSGIFIHDPRVSACVCCTPSLPRRRGMMQDWGGRQLSRMQRHIHSALLYLFLESCVSAKLCLHFPCTFRKFVSYPSSHPVGRGCPFVSRPPRHKIIRQKLY